MKNVTLSSKFQIVIPKLIREEMDLRPGQKFVLIPAGNVLHLVPQFNIQEIKGLLKGANANDIRDRYDR